MTLGRNESELVLSLLFSAVLRTMVNGGWSIRKPIGHEREREREGPCGRETIGLAVRTSDWQSWTAGDELEERTLFVDVEIDHQIEQPFHGSAVQIVAVIAASRFEQDLQVPQLGRTATAEDLMQLEQHHRMHIARMSPARTSSG
jgi:hypothetical protein